MLKTFKSSVRINGRDSFQYDNFHDGVYCFDFDKIKLICKVPRYLPEQLEQFRDNAKAQSPLKNYSEVKSWDNPFAQTEEALVPSSSPMVAAAYPVKKPKKAKISIEEELSLENFQQYYQIFETEKNNFIFEVNNYYYLIEQNELINLLLSYDMLEVLNRLFEAKSFEDKVK